MPHWGVEWKAPAPREENPVESEATCDHAPFLQLGCIASASETVGDNERFDSQSDSEGSVRRRERTL